MNDWRARLRLAVDLSGKKHWLLAEDAGITAATLSRVLTGVHPTPRFETVARIAHAAGENVGWLLREPRSPFSAKDLVLLRDIAIFLLSRLPPEE